MRSPLHPTVEDLQAFIASTAVLALCFLAYKQMSYTRLPYLILISGLVILSREVGQRTVAQWMDAYIDLQTTLNGSATSLFGAFLAFVTGLPIILLFPLTSSFSGKKYEHWGKSVDAIWAKRQYWLASSGITMLLISWFFAYLMDFSHLAEMISLFTFFQLLPLDENKKICGKLDGAYILLWTGFMWLVFMGITVIAMILSVL